MLRRIAHLFGIGKKDEALEKRFAQIKARYIEASERTELAASDPIGHLRVTGSFDKKTVIGAQTATKEKITSDLLKSVSAREIEKEQQELAGIK